MLSVLLLPAAMSAGVFHDFEQAVLYDPGYEIKDHTIIYRRGLYHMFYIRGDQTSFGHASSPNLKHWTIHDTVLYTGPEEWDERRIWAPFIVDARGEIGYELMYYTGVNNSIAQSCCLAFSFGSLYNWLKVPEENFTPFHSDTSWSAWSKDTWSNFRDPHFFEDGEYQYLLHTAWTKDHYGAIALSRSTDFLNWEDVGPLYVHDSWHVLESASLVKFGGRYHLFFTEEMVGGISYMSSDSLTTGWDIDERMIIDNGAAVEFFQVSSDRFLISRHTNYLTQTGEKISTIKIDTATFYSHYVHVDLTDYLAEDWTVLYGNAFRHQPIFRDNPSYRGEPAGGIGFEGNWWIGTYESFNGPISGTLPGAYQGDDETGAIRSKDFVITGDTLRLLVGGGYYPSSCYVALCDARNDRILFRETGEDTDLMSERFWDLSRHKGRTVYLTIVDDETEPFGHINVDGIEERSKKEDNDILWKKDLLRDKYMDTYTLRSISNDPAHRLSNHPNPFNPTTDITFSADPGAPLSLVIYDVTGREIKRIEAVAGPDGRGVALWNGEDSTGNPVTSGVYLCVLKKDGRILSTRKLILGR